MTNSLSIFLAQYFQRKKSDAMVRIPFQLKDSKFNYFLKLIKKSL
jgi:hypothetical protein